MTLPPWPFQTVSYFWKCSTARPYAVTLLPLTIRPVAAVSEVQEPAPAPWSARQAQTSSMIELLLLSTKAVGHRAGLGPADAEEDVVDAHRVARVAHGRALGRW
jgi:hypothetical protein